jgi:hypothetical protein
MDTEFIEDGSTIDLISIGIVCEDGREYYAQSVEFDHRKASEWVKENVLVHLQMCPWAQSGPEGVSGLYRTDRAYHKKYGGQCVDQQRGPVHNCPWRTREQLVLDIKLFFNPSDGIELWGYYSAYDHVAFCQLFGTMMYLPKGYPTYTRDLKQLCDSIGNPKLPEQGKGEHNALADARWNKVAYDFLQDYAQNWEGQER